MQPEEQARLEIDTQLQQEGWTVVNRDEYHDGIGAAAIREALMLGQHEADYLLLLHGKAVGVVEAKRGDIKLATDAHMRQALSYSDLMPPRYPCWQRPLPMVYLANGKDILRAEGGAQPNQPLPTFIPKQRFARPYEVQAQIAELNRPDTPHYYNQFKLLPPLNPKGLRACQVEAIEHYEQSLKDGQRKALLVLATGAGKTITACNIVYRLMRYTNQIKSVLFLVDRNNLGRAAKTAFDSFEVDGARPLAHDYGVDFLTSAQQINTNLRQSAIHVGTIQRLYAILSGQQGATEGFAPGDGAGQSALEQRAAEQYADEHPEVFNLDDDTALAQPPVELPQHKLIAPDAFDLIIIDECHRSIYSTWRKVLDYFGGHAQLLGLTATPIKESLDFFEHNLVAQYALSDSIQDGINVPPRIYRIKTQLTEQGGQIKPGEAMSVKSKYTGLTQHKSARTATDFAPSELNCAFVAPEQISTILREYRDQVFTTFYPERHPDYSFLPKTLIFAHNEVHAQHIVACAKKVFDRENDDHFAQTITYTAPDSNALIRSFRNDKDFRIAVTVTLVATGTDVPPLEVLIFMTDVRSQVLYQQMLGRGVRTISDDHLKEVTPNAQHKDYFMLIDAVGVTEHEKGFPRLTNAPDANPSLERLLEELARGVLTDDNLLLLAQKLTTIANKGDPDELTELAQIAPQLNLLDLAQAIYERCDTTGVQGTLQRSASPRTGAGALKPLPPFVSSAEPNVERKELIAILLRDIPARQKLIEIARGYFKILPQQHDTLLYSGFSQEDALEQITRFERALNELAAEDALTSSIKEGTVEVQVLSGEQLQELSSQLKHKLPDFSVKHIWDCYETIDRAAQEQARQAAPLGTLEPGANGTTAARTKADSPKVVPLDPHQEAELEANTNLLQLMRYAWHNAPHLVSLMNSSHFNRLFNLWCGQTQNDLPMAEAHQALYRELAEYIAINGAIPSGGALYELAPELYTNLCAALGSAQVQRPLDSLNRFLLLRSDQH